MRLQIVVTFRDDEIGRSHPLAGMLADLSGNQRVSRLSLQGLDAAQGERCAQSRVTGVGGAFIPLSTRAGCVRCSCSRVNTMVGEDSRWRWEPYSALSRLSVGNAGRVGEPGGAEPPDIRPPPSTNPVSPEHPSKRAADQAAAAPERVSGTDRFLRTAGALFRLCSAECR